MDEYKDSFVDGATWAKNIKQAEIDQLNEDNKWLLDNFFNRKLAIEDIENIVEIIERNKGE